MSDVNPVTGLVIVRLKNGKLARITETLAPDPSNKHRKHALVNVTVLAPGKGSEIGYVDTNQKILVRPENTEPYFIK